MMAIIGGVFMAVGHRFIASPYVGKQTYKAQSMLTPAIGVSLSFIIFHFVFKRVLPKIVPDEEMRIEISQASDRTWWQVFYSYGFAIMLMLFGDIGGVKE